MDRNDAIAKIRAGLKARSGKTWSVTGGRGTAWGWIRIDAPPARRVRDGMPDPCGYLSLEEQTQLGELLGLGERAHHQGVSIPASSAYYQEYVDRAEGRAPTIIGKPYWD
jgi:hypothetical protein